MGNNTYAYAPAHVLAHLCMLGGLGKQWETMDLTTFGLGITTGTSSGNNGKQYVYIYICADNRLAAVFGEAGVLGPHIGGLRAYIRVSEIRIDF